MVGVLARGKAVTMSRHGWGIGRTLDRDEVEGRSRVRHTDEEGRLRGNTQWSCRLEKGALIKVGGALPGSRLR